MGWLDLQQVQVQDKSDPSTLPDTSSINLVLIDEREREKEVNAPTLVKNGEPHPIHNNYWSIFFPIKSVAKIISSVRTLKHVIKWK